MMNRCKTTNPVWCVAFAFALSTAAARFVSHVNPVFHYNLRGMHIHHYMYGIFMITFAGYCALVFKSPKATFWIALLFGWGVGFTFDEMGMWLNASIDPRFRWDRDGLAIGIFALIMAALFSIVLRLRRKSLVRPAESANPDKSIDRTLDSSEKNTIVAIPAQQEE